MTVIESIYAFFMENYELLLQCMSIIDQTFLT